MPFRHLVLLRIAGYSAKYGPRRISWRGPQTFTRRDCRNRRIDHGVPQRKKDFAIANAMDLKGSSAGLFSASLYLY